MSGSGWLPGPGWRSEWWSQGPASFWSCERKTTEICDRWPDILRWILQENPQENPSHPQWHPSLCFRMKLSFVITQTQLWFQTRISGATYLRLLCQSQAWLTFLHFFTLFRVNVTCARDLRSNHSCFVASSLKLLPQTPNQKYHQLTTLEEATGRAWACLSRDCSQIPIAKRKKKKKAHRKYGALRVALFFGHEKLEPLRIGKPHQRGWVLDDQRKQKELLLLSGEMESPPSLTEAQTSLANVFRIWV